MLLDSLTLKNYRNFENSKLDFKQSRAVYIVAKNGSGKTNILEAISNFALGANFSSASDGEMLCSGKSSYNLELSSSTSNYSSKATINYSSKKKQFLVDGKSGKVRELFLQGFVLFWLTPEFCFEITTEKSELVKLIDRLIFHFDVEHIQRIRNYQKLASLRLDGLRKNLSPNYLSSLEEEITKLLVSIVVARISYSSKLSKIITNLKDPLSNFSIDVCGELSRVILNNASSLVEEQLQAEFVHNRTRDARSNQTNLGLSKNYFIIKDIKKSFATKYTSTAEKKLASLSALFACLSYIKSELSLEGYLLLDEIFANLDQDNFGKIMHILVSSEFPYILTANEREFDLASLPKNCLKLGISGNKVVYSDCKKEEKGIDI